MANRLFNQFSFGLEKMRVSLFGELITNGAGVPSMVASDSKGIASVIKIGGTGKYRITLQDQYNRLLMVQHMNLGPSSAAMVEIAAQSMPNKTVDLQFRDASGAPVDLGNGEQHLISIVLRNSTAP
jgi:hypothetical protein